MSNVVAPMPGTIAEILVEVGDQVKADEEVIILEAMKMENAIIAPFEGQISEVCVKLNDTVQEGQLLFVIEKTDVR